MSSLESRPAWSSNRPERRDADCWRIECIGLPATDASAGPELRRNRALSRWVKKLSDRPGRVHYRISTASDW